MTRLEALRYIVPGAAALAAAPFAGDLLDPPDAAAAATTGSGSAINVRDYGAKGDGSTDDTAAINAAIAAGGSACAVVAPSGTYAISGQITVPDGINLLGDGNSLGNAATTFKCTSAAAGISIQGSGGTCRDFKVDGNNIALLPLNRTSGSQRTFIAIDAVNSAQDNFHEFGAQNDTFISCNFQNAARDNLCLDNGTGGLAFVRCEVNNPGRYNLRSDNAIAGGPYLNGPSNILFSKCIFERVGSSAVSAAYLASSYVVRFEACEFYGTACQGPLIDVTGGSTLISLDGGYVVGSASAVETGISVGHYSEITITGRPQFQNLRNGIVLSSSNSSVKLDTADIFWNNVRDWYVPQGTATVEGCVVSLLQQHPLAALHGSPNDALLLSYAYGGLFFRLEASGKWSWGAGTDYGSGDTTLYRSGPGTLATDGVLHAAGGIQSAGPVSTGGTMTSGGDVVAQGRVAAAGGVHTDGMHTAAQGVHTDGPLSAAGGVRTGDHGKLAATIYSGRGAPSSRLGHSGDFYFRTDATKRRGSRLYVKSGRSWDGIL
jgi:hypothetical protein